VKNGGSMEFKLTGRLDTNTAPELTEAVKLAFDEEGIEIPYNYLNVHLTEKQKQSGQA